MSTGTEAKPAPRQAPCPNCGDVRAGNYCPSCGQRKSDRRVSLRRLLLDAVEDQLSLNGALVSTLRTLAHPGRLTTEYLAGRVGRYIPPFRLYLVTSFLFFLAMRVGGPEGEVVQLGVVPSDSAASATAVAPVTDSTALPDSAAVVERAIAVWRLQEKALNDIDGFDLPFAGSALTEDVRDRLRRLAREDPEQIDRRISREFTDQFPLAMFLLVPGVAALLALLFFRQRRFYVEHFVFALHTQSAVFLVLTLMIVLQSLGPVPPLLLVALVLYVVVALQRMYEQTWPTVALKTAVLSLGYLGMLLGAVVVTAVAAFMLTT